MLLLLIVMAALVSSGRPCVISHQAIVSQAIATRPWTQRLNVGRTQSRIGVLQRMTLRIARSAPVKTVNALTSIALAPAPINPLRCALPPPAPDRA